MSYLVERFKGIGFDSKHNTRGIYLSGPITGRSEVEYRAHFEGVSKWFWKNHKELGLFPINPCDKEYHSKHDKSYGEYMRADLKELLKCRFICMLKGWENSKGAIVEKAVAEAVGMTILYEEGEMQA